MLEPWFTSAGLAPREHAVTDCLARVPHQAGAEAGPCHWNPLYVCRAMMEHCLRCPSTIADGDRRLDPDHRVVWMYSTSTVMVDVQLNRTSVGPIFTKADSTLHTSSPSNCSRQFADASLLCKCTMRLPEVNARTTTQTTIQ